MRSLLAYYRYASWLITSAFYLVSPLSSALPLKGVLVVCLGIESYVFLKAYNAPEAGTISRKRLILMETLGFAFFVVLTGGFQSPFVWHAINPILLAATLRPTYYAWAMAVAFLGAASLLHQFHLFEPGERLMSWGEISYLLVFILITLVAQLYNLLIHKLSEQAAVMERHISHIESLYESAEVFSHREDVGQIADSFASYTKTLTGAAKVMVWIREMTGGEEQAHYKVRGPRELFREESWYTHVRQLSEDEHWSDEVVTRQCPTGRGDETGTMVAIKVQSKSRMVGLFAAFYTQEQTVEADTRRILGFLAKLCAAAMERCALERMSHDLILTEEKDRIAREMHDTVTQQLFGVVYGLNSLITDEGWDEADRDKIRLLQRMAQRGMRDLRSAIYSMSSLRSQREPFIDEVRQYLEEVAKLNGIQLDFSSEGSFASVDSGTRHSLYRIIREATANAIRHGQCSVLQVCIEGDDDRVRLSVIDNGLGFDPAGTPGGEEGGLGLTNMKDMVGKMGGKIRIESSPDEGTSVLCSVPTSQQWKEGRTG